MRLSSAGSLTVQLIRLCRFSVDPPACFDPQHTDGLGSRVCCDRRGEPRYAEAFWHRIDRVELSREALASDAWALDASRKPAWHAQPVREHEQERQLDPPIALPPRTITPVVGSPALAGLGVSLIVPGTLLDVVA
ncbi:MAG: hypothetical protein ACE37H_04745 [Phycisphaeraceae bacterium]